MAFKFHKFFLCYIFSWMQVALQVSLHPFQSLFCISSFLPSFLFVVNIILLLRLNIKFMSYRFFIRHYFFRPQNIDNNDTDDIQENEPIYEYIYRHFGNVHIF